MKNIISFDELCSLAKQKNLTYFYTIKKNKNLFVGNLDQSIEKVNNLVESYQNNSTGHCVVASLRWAFEKYYGDKFNSKLIKSRPNSISKFTTRLSKEEIIDTTKKFLRWIQEEHFGLTAFKQLSIENSRTRIYHCFKSLISSGMRVGELVGIDFSKLPANRTIKNFIDDQKVVEMIINTEKTCKKREIYIPLDSYEFFVKDHKKLSRSMIIDGFISFRRWAKLPYKLTAHVCRRSLASIMHEMGVDVPTIAMVLGNTPGVVMNHYIISSGRNFDACEIAYASIFGGLSKTNNIFFNKRYLGLNKT